MPMAELEKQTILGTIAQLNGDKLMAARMLGIGKDYAVPQAEGVCFPGLKLQPAVTVPCWEAATSISQ